jgi:hypothetical protein
MKTINNTPTQSTRLKIAKEYCRSIAVLDDDIDPSKPDEYQRFAKFSQCCSDYSILCHLFQYPKIEGDPEDCEVEFLRAVKIANAADVVVLDWHLSGNNSPAHAKKLLKEITNVPSVKFIIINTNAFSTGIEEELRQIFPFNLQNIPSNFNEVNEEEDESPIVIAGEQITPPINYQFLINNSIFIWARQKNTSTEIDAQDLLKYVFNSLSGSFTDYMHWAGLELAARSRVHILRIIDALPKGMDTALLFQLLHQEADEVSHKVAEILLEDLKNLFEIEPLHSINDNALFENLVHLMKGKIADESIVTVFPKNLKDNIQSGLAKKKDGKHLSREEINASLTCNKLLEKWNNSELSDLRKMKEEYFPSDDPELISKTIDFITTGEKNQSKGHTSWASLNESYLPIQKMPDILRQGIVLKRLFNTECQPRFEFLLCITPSCDCYRPKLINFKYLFIEGQAINLDKKPKRQSITNSTIKDTHIAWDATKLIVIENPLQTQGEKVYDVIGQLRPLVTQRIIQRLWTYQSRVGIDTSELIRIQRGEGN